MTVGATIATWPPAVKGTAGSVSNAALQLSTRSVRRTTQNEMTDPEVVDELCSLLCLLPGVSIAWKQTPHPGYRIGLKIDDARSLSLLVHCNKHWNILFCVEAEWSCTEPHDEPSCLRYDLRIPAWENACVVGQVLIGRLRSRGLLTPEDAERRMQMWLFPDDA